LCPPDISGVDDVRLLGPYTADKWLPFLSGRYYWNDGAAAGVKVYQYWERDDARQVVAGDGRMGIGPATRQPSIIAACTLTS